MSHLILSASVFAAEAHAGQVRKELNVPYIVHPLRVAKLAAQLGMDDEFIAACTLHDVVEDDEYTHIPMITIQAMFPERTYKLVHAMTKWWKDQPDSARMASYQAYYDNLRKTKDGALLKVLDRSDNLNDFAKMARMSQANHKWSQRYYAKTVREVTPLLEQVKIDNPTIFDRVEAIYTVAVGSLKVALD